ncbi:MAG TPA: hypothetical protein VIO11_03510 [Candidatus Methanoperedens sp.]
MLRGTGCSCGYVCLDNSEEACERYQNPLSCREYKNLRNQNRMRALEKKGQKNFLAGGWNEI